MAKYIGPVKIETPKIFEFTHEEVKFLCNVLNMCTGDLKKYHKCTEDECKLSFGVWKAFDQASEE